MKIKTPLSDERRDEVVDKLASWIIRKRLATMATVFVEINRPLTFLSSQALLFGNQILAEIFGEKNIHEAYQLLSDRQNADRLLDRIQHLSDNEREKKEQAREASKPAENA